MAPFLDVSKLPESVTIMEVGPRDGLQNEKRLVPTENKIQFIEDLADAGLRRIEVTAFVSPRWIPTLADQFEVVRGIKKKSGVTYAALVPNVQGYERAVDAGVDEVSVVVSASETHNVKNLNADTETVLQRYREVATRALADGMPFRAYVSCAFGCPYEGDIAHDRVVQMANFLHDLGAYELSIGDTIGVASPLDVAILVPKLLMDIDVSHLALHMHDTRGSALACIFSAMLFGIRSFDSSAGGLGGCPYAKGAAGNAATEDVVYMLHKMGIATGIDLDKLCRVSLGMEQILGKNMVSKLVAIKRAESVQP